jgi:hypothetical protein
MMMICKYCKYYRPDHVHEDGSRDGHCKRWHMTHVPETNVCPEWFSEEASD